MLFKIQNNVRNALKIAGAVRMQEAWRGVSGDVWVMLACVDKLVELGHLNEVVTAGYRRLGPHRVFVAGPNYSTN